MKVALAQINYHTGNFQNNKAQILDNIQKGKEEGADLVLFAELALTGYPPRDFLEFDHFLGLCEQALEEIAIHAVGIGVVVGAPAPNKSGQGKLLYNAAYVLYDGKIQHIIAKTLLPTYDVFDEYRYFEPSDGNVLVDFKGKRLAITICEDLWNVGHHARYKRQPLSEIDTARADFIINIAASPFSIHHEEERLFVLEHAAKTYHKPVFYVNHVGAQTELIFDGSSMVLDAKGQVRHQLKRFRQDFLLVDTDALGASQVVAAAELSKSNIMADVRAALVLGIRDYFQKLGFEKAIIGLSGGIDSALVTVLAAEALGAGKVHALLLPSRYSSDHSINDSMALCNNLKVSYDIVSIEKAFAAYEETLQPFFAGRKADITEENLQSRIRGMLLMAYTNKFGYILLNTSNKSELAVGYGTLYGDMCGGLSVIGDLYKTEVNDLCAYINRDEEIIPAHILFKPPSAELRPDQKDSDSLPDYDVLDKLLRLYLEERKSPEEIRLLGFDEQLVNKVMRLVNMNEYKRHQTPPILRVSRKAFGMGRRMPIVAKYLA